jgi:transposase InsO family protein
MDDDAIRINRTNGVTSWRAGCGESRTSGSGGGPEKPTDRNVGRALRSDPYTYVPFKKGFWYLVAIMDWHSRKVLSWRLSNTMTSDFCVAALHEALALYGTPEIFNTDQGSQFTSEAFTSVVKDADVKISMDGVGRAIDNVFIERLWRTLKYDHVYLNRPSTATRVATALVTTCITTTVNGRTVHLTTRPLTRSTINHASTSEPPELGDN